VAQGAELKGDTVRITIRDIQAMKEQGKRIPMLTAYDYPTARIIDEAGIPLILVGDSLGQVVLGYDSTIPVTMGEMLHHIKAVTRGAKNSLVVGDLPFMTYQLSVEHAMTNAGRMMQEGAAGAVKLEGGRHVAESVRRIVECGIPVMGHLGLTPQSIHQLSGYRVQGKTPKTAANLMEDAHALQDAGAFAIVLELIPTAVAAAITQRLTIPTIGIGAGPSCDGQIQVLYDILGLTTGNSPRHSKPYAALAQKIKNAVAQYADEVESERFPTDKESFDMDEIILAKLIAGRS
jgi:3-methyl-2-oxobutanoate hydroxymethyltransferase